VVQFRGGAIPPRNTNRASESRRSEDIIIQRIYISEGTDIEFSDEASVADLTGHVHSAFQTNSYIARIVTGGEVQSAVVLPPNARSKPGRLEHLAYSVVFAAGAAAALGQRVAIMKDNGEIDVSFPVR
jgi:hypothetical protein